MQITHTPGRHCASTALANLTRFHNVPLSEPMCFGLGEGLGIFYLTIPGGKPSRMIAVRSLAFEQQFFNNLGMSFQWNQHADPLESEKALKEALDAGLPAIIQTDIYYLPYYQSKTHFAGHLINVWGYDDAEQVFHVTDTERTEVYAVPYEAMRRARYCRVPPFPMDGNLFAPSSIQIPTNLGDRIWQAVQSNSRRLLENDSPFDGLQALRQWRDEVGAWTELPDWQWAARFAYQTIMKRGTGGGGFRLMYADFLEEGAEHTAVLREKKLAPQMRAVGKAWDELAIALKAASDAPTPDFTAAGQQLTRVYDLESRYHDTVVS
jgi:hypothetical protein